MSTSPTHSDGRAMSDEQLRIAVAEQMGWQKMQCPLSDQDGEIPGHFELRWFHPKIHTSVYPQYVLPKEPPNFPASLDACASFEATLSMTQLAEMDTHLNKMERGYVSATFATARQRCLAYLATVAPAKPK